MDAELAFKSSGWIDYNWKPLIFMFISDKFNFKIYIRV